MNRGQAWFVAIRPRSLTMAVTPVLVGTAIAMQQQSTIDWLTAFVALFAAVLIQVATNLHNDAADFERGADTANRIGPPRATAQGWISGAEVRRGALLCFAAAFVCGIYLVAVGGWPIMALGIASLIAGAAYSGGPWPLSYSSFSELFVYLFFGVAAVMGSYYLQIHRLDWIAFEAGSALGLIAAAVLVVNNSRDLIEDRRAGRKTLAVRFGIRFSRVEYLLLLLLPFATLFCMSGSVVIWVPMILLPFALLLIGRFFNNPSGDEMNLLLVRTAQLQFLFGLLLIVALML